MPNLIGYAEAIEWNLLDSLLSVSIDFSCWLGILTPH